METVGRLRLLQPYTALLSARKMKTSGVIICCVLAALTLSCESVNQKLNSIDDLKRIHSRQSVPQHSIFLLYWFADTVRFDNYGTITMPFNPNTDYGSHHYGNYEGMLGQPPRGHQYYAVGNVNTDRYNALPEYIRNLDRRNRGRIIFSAETSGVHTRTINRVYLTQHVRSSSNEYDPAHTYPISTNLLREISQISNPTVLWRRLQPWDDNSSYYPQSISTGGTPHLQSSSSHRGNDGIGDCVCLALVLLVMLIVGAGFMITQAPKY